MARLLPLLFACTLVCPGQTPVNSREKERTLGRRLAGEVERTSIVLDDPAIADYLDRIAQRITARCPVEVPIAVRVIFSRERNAFALPGGFLFVNTALLRSAASEAELAGVLAHLIAHLRTGGLIRPAGDAPAVNYGSIPLIYMGGRLGYSYSPDAATLVPLAVAEAYRAAVFAADAGGLPCAVEAGYDPEAFIRGLEKLPTKSLSTHPPAAERVERARAVLATLAPRAEYVVSTDRFNETGRRVEAIEGRQRRAEPPSLRN